MMYACVCGIAATDVRCVFNRNCSAGWSGGETSAIIAGERRPGAVVHPREIRSFADAALHYSVLKATGHFIMATLA